MRRRKLQEANSAYKYMSKPIKVGDEFSADDYEKLVSKVLGQELSNLHNRCGFHLQELKDDGIAWFVYMDGTVHGTNKYYMWSNKLSSDGETIIETLESKSDWVWRKCGDNVRLSFRLEDTSNGKKTYCKFVGLFELVSVDDDNYQRVYKKIADKFKP